MWDRQESGGGCVVPGSYCLRGNIGRTGGCRTQPVSETDVKMCVTKGISGSEGLLVNNKWVEHSKTKHEHGYTARAQGSTLLAGTIWLKVLRFQYIDLFDISISKSSGWSVSNMHRPEAPCRYFVTCREKELTTNQHKPYLTPLLPQYLPELNLHFPTF